MIRLTPLTRRESLTLAVALVIGVIAGANWDAAAPPFTGREHLEAVFMIDGQAYFGHLEDAFWEDSVTLRDVYYLADARQYSSLGVALTKRGTEVHLPADGMRIRRERILAIEHVGVDSPVAQAIAAQRALTAAR